MRKTRQHSKTLLVRAAEAPRPLTRAHVGGLYVKKRLKALGVLRAEVFSLEGAREDAPRVREEMALAIQMAEMAIPWPER